MPHRILRLPAVKERTGLSRSTIYLRMSQNTFQASIGLGGRAAGWLEEDIDNWLVGWLVGKSRELNASFN